MKRDTLLADWQDEMITALLKSQSFSVAVFTETELVFATPAFQFLCAGNEVNSLLNPTLEQLWAMPPLETDSDCVFSGYLTLGDWFGSNTSLTVDAFRRRGHLLLVGGIDVAQLLEHNKRLHLLNQEVNNMQREAIRHSRELSTLIDRLNVTNLDLYEMNLQNQELNRQQKASLEEVKSLNESLAENNATLAELVATKDKFFSIVAHDLRSPFNSILGLSALLARNAATYTPERIARLAEGLHTASKETYALLENLLEWARLQRGALQPTREPLQAEHLLHDLNLQFQPIALAKNLTLLTSCHSLRPFTADMQMCSTVLRNLLSNAIKFSFPGSQVVLRAVEQEAGCCFVVQDFGTGIEPDNLGRLFRIDSKLSQLGTANEHGTGLGLILCKEFVALNNGQIWVESEWGSGSSFYVLLPWA